MCGMEIWHRNASLGLLNSIYSCMCRGGEHSQLLSSNKCFVFELAVNRKTYFPFLITAAS